MIDRVGHKPTTVRPRWIQMFLVSKRRSGSRPERIELAPLEKGQKLHLNLAASPGLSPFPLEKQQQLSLFGDGKSEHQLQLVCQVGGSLPEAKIEWHKHTSHAIDESTNSIPDQAGIDSNARSQIGRLPLISDSKFETRSLIHASEPTSAGPITSTILLNTTNNSTLFPIQWSSVKVHNITFEDHQKVISCSAFNEQFKSSSSDGDISTGLSTSLKLNITHVPSIKLELDSTTRASELESPSHISLEDRSEHNVIALRDGPRLNTFTSSRRGYNADHSDGFQVGNAKSGDERENDAIPILIGHNYTLVCGIIFANPRIHDPIEWYLSFGELNKFRTFDDVYWLVKVVERISTQNRYNTIERLIVQFSDASKSQKKMELKCKARNALGQSQSNTIKIVPGQRPKCHEPDSSSFKSVVDDKNDSNNSGNNPTDKMSGPSIHCPVISDKSSSKYHWLLRLNTDRKNRKMLADNLPAITTDLTHFSSIKPNFGSTDIENSPTATKIVSNAFEFFTSNQTIQLPTLRLILSNNSLNRAIEENGSLVGLKITCFVVDKFGANVHDPCAVSLIGGGQRSSPSPLASHNQCAASLVHQNNLPAEVGKSESIPTNNLSALNTTGKKVLEPKQVLIIECKDDNANNSSQLKRVRGSNLKERKDEVVHFDLYTRDENKFVKHLTSYLKDEDSNNLSLKIDLGQELSSLPVEDLGNHIVVMSLTDSNNRQKQPNVTLALANANFYSDSISTLARSSDIPLFRSPDSGQVFPHTRSSDLPPILGREDEPWVISTICVVLASSAMILLITWMCSSNDSSGKNESQGPATVNNKSDSNNSTNGSGESSNKADNSDNNNNGTSQATDLAQTEMYLAGEQLQVARPSVYHNFSTSKPSLSTSVTNIHEKQDQRDCNLVATSFNYNHNTGHPYSGQANSSNPYDLLIIDSKLSNNTHEDVTKQAILLVDDQHARDHQDRFDREFSGGCSSQSGSVNRAVACTDLISGGRFNQNATNENQCHAGSVTHLHPSLDNDNNSFLRAIYCDQGTTNDCLNLANQNLRVVPAPKSVNSSEARARNGANIGDKYSPGQYEFIDLDCRAHRHHLVRSPIGLVTSVVSQIPVRYNNNGFELNSLGELTMTDESSSFIQEEGANDIQLNFAQSVCNQCRIDNNKINNTFQQDGKSLDLASDCCKECQRITPNTTLSDGNQSNTSVSLLSPKNINFDPSPASNQISTLNKLATSTENEGKRSERVRFVDNAL